MKKKTDSDGSSTADENTDGDGGGSPANENRI